MKNLKQIGILVFLSLSMCAMSQNRIVNRMDRSVKALTQLQKMMGWEDEPKTNEPQNAEQNPVSDIDDNVYQTVKVGDNIWMAENLKVNRYQNGDSIANITDSATWVGLSTGAWCEYNNDHSNGEKFGKLYNFFAVSDKRGLAPKGWHVATKEEWNKLRDYFAGGTQEVNGKIYTSIIVNNNMMNFKLNAGVRSSENFYDGDNSFSFYWTSKAYDENNGAIYWKHENGSNGLLITSGGSWYENNKINGCSVRCVKDAPLVKQEAKKIIAKKNNK